MMNDFMDTPGSFTAGDFGSGFSDDDLFGIGLGQDDQGSAMDQMYQEFILEQARDPHGKMPEDSFSAANDTLVSSRESADHASCLVSSHQFNPTCGDDVTVQIRVGDHPGTARLASQSDTKVSSRSGGTLSSPSDLAFAIDAQSPDAHGETGPIITDMCWTGHGCAICQASLSVLHDMVENLPVDRFGMLYDEFHELMDSRGRGVDDPRKQEDLGDALAFQGTSRFPMRIKCALLGWEAVRDCLGKSRKMMTDNEDHDRQE